MVGSFVGLVVTFIANPLLHDAGVLTTWKEGNSTLETIYANNVDFYLSFGIGLSLAVAFIGLYQTFAGLKKRKNASFDKVESIDKPSKKAGGILVILKCGFAVSPLL